MKKYILKFALVALSMGALVSCDEDTVTYGGKNFVSFDKVASTRYTFFENGGVSEIPVNLAFPVSSDINVTFTVQSDVAVVGEHYNVLTPGSFTIPAGETTGYIKIEVLDNDIMNDSKSINVTLTGISDSNVTLGLEDEASKYKRFLIVNDDCTTNFLEFVGVYNVQDTGTGAVIGTAEVDVNEDADCNVLRISGILDNVYDSTIDTFINFELRPGNNPTTGENVGTLSAYQQLYCAECFSYEGAQQNILYTGTGNFNLNVNPKRLSINGSLSFANGISIGSPTVTLIPVE